MAFLAWGLLTGRTYWGDVSVKRADGTGWDVVPGSATMTKYDRGDVWAILGPCPATWWWVRRWGTLRCGCGRNPLTRRMSWYSGDCKYHELFLTWGEPGEPKRGAAEPSGAPVRPSEGAATEAASAWENEGGS